MIEIAPFKTEQANIDRQTLNQLKLNFIGQNQPLQYGFPLIIFVKIADQLYQASQKFKDYILLALTNDNEALKERITQRFKGVVGKPFNLNIINSYFIKHLQSGFGISMGYDVLFTENCQSLISLRATEMQSNITCLYWQSLILQVARTALKKSQFKPKRGLEAINQFSQTPEIFIVDVDPVRQSTRLDLQTISELVSGSGSHLVSIYEIYRQGRNWLADIHDSTGRLLKTEKIVNIICRLVPDEIREVLSTLPNQADRILGILDFFADSILQWI